MADKLNRADDGADVMPHMKLACPFQKIANRPRMAQGPIFFKSTSLVQNLRREHDGDGGEGWRRKWGWRAGCRSASMAISANLVPRNYLWYSMNFGTKFWTNNTIWCFDKAGKRNLSKFGETKLRRYPKFDKIKNLSLGLRIQNLDLS